MRLIDQYFARYQKHRVSPINCSQSQSTGPVVLDKDGNVTIKIQAKPGAKCNNVTGKEKRFSNLNKDALRVLLDRKNILLALSIV